MSFQLPYICKKGRNKRFVHLPDFYFNFVKSEDVSQIFHGLNDKKGKEPNDSQIRQSTINLAKQRRGDR